MGEEEAAPAQWPEQSAPCPDAHIPVLRHSLLCSGEPHSLQGIPFSEFPCRSVSPCASIECVNTLIMPLGSGCFYRPGEASILSSRADLISAAFTASDWLMVRNTGHGPRLLRPLILPAVSPLESLCAEMISRPLEGQFWPLSQTW